MKVALVYDRVNKFGGAERVLLVLHKLFPKAPLYTSVYDPQKAPWAKVFKVKTSFLQHIPFAKAHHEWFAAFMPVAFESFDLSAYDLVISVTSEAAKGVRTSASTVHICYCLTPTRYLWSGYKDYFRNPLFKIISYPIIWYLKRWDKTAAKKPDVYIAISKEVQKRIKKYYKKDSKVIYPSVSLAGPVSLHLHPTSSLTPFVAGARWGSPSLVTRQGYFLVVSRLVSYKRINIAIKACNKLRLPLRIVGTGSQFSYLRSIAGPTIEFLGNLTDKELVEYYKNCKALLFPGKEDLGLVIIEAASFGKPVIAYQGGGALETVVEGKTGDFFYPQNARALSKKIEKFLKKKYNSKVIKAHAKKFGKDRFEKEFIKEIARIVETKKNNI